MYESIVEEILNGRRLTAEDDLSFLVHGDLQSLTNGANKIRAELCGNYVNLCSIINGRSGKCSENCKFCAQSSHHRTGAKVYDILAYEDIEAECKRNEAEGVHRFSIVTSGRTLKGCAFEETLQIYSRLNKACPNIALCGSHGLLNEEQFIRLKQSGVTRYHCNIETSRRNFPNICTTHTFDEKIKCIKAAKKAGLEVCSGGIIGMGETWDDRIDMALTLSELGILSIPINVLMPIKGTPFGDLTQITESEILRTTAMFRFINPTAYIRLAAGRRIMRENGKYAFFAGANATITGDMLTTSGNNTHQDKKMLIENGFDISR